MREPEESSTIAHASLVPISRAAPRPTCIVDGGPDAGLRFELDETCPDRALIGKSPACALRLTDPLVSRRHAALEIRGSEVHLVDLGSLNGTWLSGTRIADIFVRGGERVRLGDTTVVLSLGEPGPAKDPRMGFGRVLGVSPEMQRLYVLLERLALSSVPVVIEGETGTGKEFVAESLHMRSSRAGGPFVVVDCTTLAPNLIESELFGHERGAFTGAVASHKGAFEQADGGTLFIDEIGDLDASLQPKLLRAIERGEVRRLGGIRWLKVDARIVAATRRDLDHEVQEGRFRDDLFFRLAVGRVELPPLRRRTGDIAFLATVFWEQLSGGTMPLPTGLVDRLQDRAWPGNVRQLHNVIARELALGDLAPPSGRAPAGEAKAAREGVFDLPFAIARQRAIHDFEQEYVARMLAKHGTPAKAAAASGMAARWFRLVRARTRP